MDQESFNFNHVPVLLKETIEHLNCRNGLIYIDGTAGGAGHSCEIAKKILPSGKLFSLDLDPFALKTAGERLSEWNDNVTVLKANYSDIPEVLRKFNIEKITGGILLDLGTSYFQLTHAEKGFSFLKEAELDMRFDPQNPMSAYNIVNEQSEEKLVLIFQNYGEERFSKRIAKKIVEKRKMKPVQTTIELANIVKEAVPNVKQKIHPATRVFQAIRIAVNDELQNLENALNKIIPLMEKDSRIAVISFHSLEDRLVKNVFKYYSSNCRCSPNQPICSCEPAILEVITKKPVVASPEEVKENPPSRSAKLRVARRI